MNRYDVSKARVDRAKHRRFERMRRASQDRVRARAEEESARQLDTVIRQMRRVSGFRVLEVGDEVTIVARDLQTSSLWFLASITGVAAAISLFLLPQVFWYSAVLCAGAAALAMSVSERVDSVEIGVGDPILEDLQWFSSPEHQRNRPAIDQRNGLLRVMRRHPSHVVTRRSTGWSRLTEAVRRARKARGR